MSNSTLSVAHEGLEPSEFETDTPEPVAPTQTSELEKADPALRDRIVSMLHWDDEEDRDQRTAELGANEGRTDWNVNTPGNYSTELEGEIRDSVAADMDDDRIVYPSLPSAEEIARQDAASLASLRQYLAGQSRRNRQEAA